jgi:hypothetical protein
MDLIKVNQFEAEKQPDTTTTRIYRTLSKFHNKDLTLLPYSFEYVHFPSNCPY